MSNGDTTKKCFVCQHCYFGDIPCCEKSGYLPIKIISKAHAENCKDYEQLEIDCLWARKTDCKYLVNKLCTSRNRIAYCPEIQKDRCDKLSASEIKDKMADDETFI